MVSCRDGCGKNRGSAHDWSGELITEGCCQHPGPWPCRQGQSVYLNGTDQENLEDLLVEAKHLRDKDTRGAMQKDEPKAPRPKLTNLNAPVI